MQRVSPTAHYTARVWAKHGLAPPAFDTPLGRVLERALRPLDRINRSRGHRTLEQMLVTRHRLLDQQLEAAIDEGDIGQVIEIGAGLSARGLRMRKRHRSIVYVETDLPAIIEYKRTLLEHRDPDHRLEAIDITQSGGPGSLEALGRSLDPRRGTAFVTEGLVPYLDPASVASAWRSIATSARSFPVGVYLTDLNLRCDVRRDPGAAVFRALLSAFVRGRVRLHFDRPRDVTEALRHAGFDQAWVIAPPEDQGRRPLVRCGVARVEPASHGGRAPT